ncbi:ABC transporter permease [Labrys monachus]|uniref:Ribose transport system permease protein n=1 Tax=Labrys monachus TaxID=217067 RepID=A0ABU0FL31_9HYPH|nr:ABC transporter permease [Labrys monachus]MDQ0394803.1 ribose transport system permease protein [Labrys monachus]
MRPISVATAGTGRRFGLRAAAIEYSTWLLLLALVAVGTWVTPLFLTIGNFNDILQQSSIVGVMAIGQFLVILTGGIDLGVGSMLALSAIVGALGVSVGPIAGIAGSLAVCGAIGAATGIVVALGRMPPFIVTFGVLAIARGVALTITSGKPVNLAPSWFLDIGTGLWPQTIWAGVILIAFLILAKLPTGRHIYATGGNIDAARVSGIDTTAILVLVYTLSALCAAIGGLIFTARSTVALPTYGAGYELQTIAACVLGGTDLFGGTGKLSGVVLGVIILTMLSNILDLTGVNPFWNFIAVGAALWISVSFRSRLTASGR